MPIRAAASKSNDTARIAVPNFVRNTRYSSASINAADAPMIIASTRLTTTSRLPPLLGSESVTDPIRQQSRHLLRDCAESEVLPADGADAGNHLQERIQIGPTRAGPERDIQLPQVLQQQRHADRRDQHVEPRRVPQRPVREPLDREADDAADDHRRDENRRGDPKRRTMPAGL